MGYLVARPRLTHSFLALCARAPRRAELQVRTLDGDCFWIDTDLRATVLSCKQSIQEMRGMHACMPRISWMLCLHESTVARRSVSIQKQSPSRVRTCSSARRGARAHSARKECVSRGRATKYPTFLDDGVL